MSKIGAGSAGFHKLRSGQDRTDDRKRNGAFAARRSFSDSRALRGMLRNPAASAEKEGPEPTGSQIILFENIFVIYLSFAPNNVYYTKIISAKTDFEERLLYCIISGDMLYFHV